MHLGPKTYGTLQYLVHGNYKKTLPRLQRFLGFGNGDIVVELGCGAGSFSEYFIKQGCTYYGIDKDAERIEVAEKNRNDGFFILTDLMAFDFSSLPPCKHFFCHGVLHHLDNDQCHQLIERVTNLGSDVKFVAIEPIRPDHWYLNPIGTIVSNLDEGNYIRTIISWKELYSSRLEQSYIMPLLPRWPLKLFFMRFMLRGKIVKDVSV